MRLAPTSPAVAELLYPPQACVAAPDTQGPGPRLVYRPAEATREADGDERVRARRPREGGWGPVRVTPTSPAVAELLYPPQACAAAPR